MEKIAEPIQTACNDKGIDYKGCFDCQGYLSETLHGAVQEKLGLTDDQWAGMVEEMTGRPNDEDEANAKIFARNVLNS